MHNRIFEGRIRDNLASYVPVRPDGTLVNKTLVVVRKTGPCKCKGTLHTPVVPVAASLGGRRMGRIGEGGYEYDPRKSWVVPSLGRRADREVAGERWEDGREMGGRADEKGRMVEEGDQEEVVAEEVPPAYHADAAEMEMGKGKGGGKGKGKRIRR